MVKVLLVTRSTLVHSGLYTISCSTLLVGFVKLCTHTFLCHFTINICVPIFCQLQACAIYSLYKLHSCSWWSKCYQINFFYCGWSGEDHLPKILNLEITKLLVSGRSIHLHSRLYRISCSTLLVGFVKLCTHSFVTIILIFVHK